MTIQLTKVTHSQIVKHGYVLSLPGLIVGGRIGLGAPDIYSESVSQLFPLGTKLEFSDGRLFRYAKWGATSTEGPYARMLVNANHQAEMTGYEDTEGFYGDLYTAVVAGATYVDLEKATEYAENWFEDGFLVCFHDTTNSFFSQYRIAGNEKGNTTYCRVYIDNEGGLKGGISATEGVSAYRSIYSNVRQGSFHPDYYPTVGIAQASSMTADSFGWIQRRGLCWITPVAYFGDSANERAVQPNQGADGTSQVKNHLANQEVGYLSIATISGYGDTLVWLTIE